MNASRPRAFKRERHFLRDRRQELHLATYEKRRLALFFRYITPWSPTCFASGMTERPLRAMVCRIAALPLPSVEGEAAAK